MTTKAAKWQRQRERREARSLDSVLEPSSAPLVAPLAKEASMRSVRAVIDSGAEDTVAPPGVLPGEVAPSKMSRAGSCYRAANGAAIKNLGQMVTRFTTKEGTSCGMPFQIAEVERPLVSVARLVDAGNRVEFDRDGGRIINAVSGKVVRLRRDGNIFALEMFVAAKPEEEGRGKEAGVPGFTRQER